MYESWIVNELNEPIYKCSDYTEKEIDKILNEHPEYSIKCLPL